jgi:hypothetical protein
MTNRQFSLTLSGKHEPKSTTAPKPSGSLSNSKRYNVEGLLGWLEDVRTMPKLKGEEQAFERIIQFIGKHYNNVTTMKAAFLCCSDVEQAVVRREVKKWQEDHSYECKFELPKPISGSGK